MSVTYYVVLSFVENDEGDLIAEEPRELQGDPQARALARTLKDQKAGVIAFSRTGDPNTGDFKPAIELVRYGRVPDDLISEPSGGDNCRASRRPSSIIDVEVRLPPSKISVADQRGRAGGKSWQPC